jgi:hypothetical protein
MNYPGKTHYELDGVKKVNRLHHSRLVNWFTLHFGENSFMRVVKIALLSSPQQQHHIAHIVHAAATRAV